MKIVKESIRFFLLLILIAGAIAAAVSTIWTIIPDNNATKECMLGYHAHCSFTPISTLISFFIAFLFCYILIRTKLLKNFKINI